MTHFKRSRRTEPSAGPDPTRARPVIGWDLFKSWVRTSSGAASQPASQPLRQPVRQPASRTAAVVKKLRCRPTQAGQKFLCKIWKREGGRRDWQSGRPAGPPVLRSAAQSFRTQLSKRTERFVFRSESGLPPPLLPLLLLPLLHSQTLTEFLYVTTVVFSK